MAQLRRGARQILDLLYADLAAIDDYAGDNPAAVRRLVRKMKERLQEELEPMLQRAEQPPLEARVKAIEEELAQLRAGNITHFNNKKAG